MRFRYSSTTPRVVICFLDGLLDLRDRGFLNLEALASLRKQRHRADHDCEKSCCHERSSSIHSRMDFYASVRVRQRSPSC